MLSMNMWIGKFSVIDYTVHDAKKLKLETNVKITLHTCKLTPNMTTHLYRSIMRLASIIHNLKRSMFG